MGVYARVCERTGSPIFFLFFSFPSRLLLRVQCQAGHGPRRLLRHCALRFQSSPRLIPAARTGISPRHSPRRGGLGSSPSRRSREGCRCSRGGMRGLPAPPSPRVRGPLPARLPRLPDFYLDNWKCGGGCAPPASRGALQPRVVHLVTRGCLGREMRGSHGRGTSIARPESGEKKGGVCD